MLLRSSSTPILGSLVSSSSNSSLCFSSDSPSTLHHGGCGGTASAIHYPAASCHLSPVSDHSDYSSSSLGFRRTLSESNLRSLLSEHSDDHRHQHHPPIPPRRRTPSLETIPSFSIFSSNVEMVEEEDESEKEEEPDRPNRFFSIGDGIAGEKNYLSADMNGVAMGENPGAGAVSGISMTPLFLARGLGIDRIGSGLFTAGGDCTACGGGGGGGGGGNCKVTTGSGGDQSDVESYYKRMVEEDPSNALFLRNYAQFLHQTKGDPKRAEEYYSRAILADPRDGEILSEYAKLIWEFHRDEERACSYFEQAVQSTPEDSHVLAAYAGFLWETETDEDQSPQADSSQDFFAESFRNGALTSATS